MIGKVVDFIEEINYPLPKEYQPKFLTNKPLTAATLQGFSYDHLTRNNMNTVTVFDISAGVVAKGQRAWTKIKATAEETRILWLEIGNALAVGRHQNPSNKLYGAWVKAYGFNDLGETTRKNALWLSSNWDLLGRDGLIEIPKEFTHPTNIRAWAREQEYEAALPEDAPEVTIVATPKFATHRDAVKFIKVDQRAETDDEGSAIAKRRRAAIAKSKDTTVEALRKEASATAPDEAYRFNPTAQKAIDSMRSNLRGSAAAMELDGLTKAQIKDIFLQFANSL